MLLHADDESEWNISTITMKYLRVIYAIFTLSLPAPPSDTCGFLLAVCQIFHSYLARVAYYTMRFSQKTAKSTINRLKISKSSAAVGSGWGRWVRAIDTKTTRRYRYTLSLYFRKAQANTNVRIRMGMELTRDGRNFRYICTCISNKFWSAQLLHCFAYYITIYFDSYFTLYIL